MHPEIILIAAAALVVVLLLLRFLGLVSWVACISLGVLVVLIGGLVSVKMSQIKTMMASKWSLPPTPVTTAAVSQDDWEPFLPAVGSIAAVQGVTVSAQLDGNVSVISFEAGSLVKAGDLLVQQDVTSEMAQLAAAQAAAELARLNLQRSRELLDKETISQQQYDSDDAVHKQAVAQAANIQATIAKKTIRAPFAGRLGIRLVNLGQTLRAGDPIVSLQALKPIYADFYLPQQWLSEVATGMPVQVSTGALHNFTGQGSITAMNPDVDSATRNVKVEATIANGDELLRPGMFVDVKVLLPTKARVLVIPSTSVLYAPYGDSVFVVDDAKDADGKPVKVARQQFVRLGEKRGDFVAVVSGLKAGEVVVTTGAFKLRNGLQVTIDNRLAPAASLTPQPENS